MSQGHIAGSYTHGICMSGAWEMASAWHEPVLLSNIPIADFCLTATSSYQPVNVTPSWPDDSLISPQLPHSLWQEETTALLPTTRYTPSLSLASLGDWQPFADSLNWATLNPAGYEDISRAAFLGALSLVLGLKAFKAFRQGCHIRQAADQAIQLLAKKQTQNLQTTIASEKSDRVFGQDWLVHVADYRVLLQVFQFLLLARGQARNITTKMLSGAHTRKDALFLQTFLKAEEQFRHDVAHLGEELIEYNCNYKSQINRRLLAEFKGQKRPATMAFDWFDLVDEVIKLLDSYGGFEEIRALLFLQKQRAQESLYTAVIHETGYLQRHGADNLILLTANYDDFLAKRAHATREISSNFRA